MNIKLVLERWVAIVTGNYFMQKLLENMVMILQYFQGVGSGSFVERSGEKGILTFLQKSYSREGDLCIFDVGANKGEFVFLVKKTLGYTGFYLHAFEPSKHTYELLLKNNGTQSNVKLNNVGLSSAEGEVDLFADALGSGLASMHRKQMTGNFPQQFGLVENVKVTTLDRYCEEEGIAKIDLLKIDVEGHELEVVKGAIRLLSQGKIRMVSFEFGSCNIDVRNYLQDFIAFFQSYGLTNIWRVTPSGYLYPIKRYREIYEQFGTTNFLISAK